MKFIQAEWTVGAEVISHRITAALESQENVLWLLAGGSNVPVEIFIMQKLLGYEQKLTIAMADERYGQPGHADSNWRQLQDAGFEHGRATFLPTLHENMTLEQTAIRFNQNLGQAFNNSGLVIGQFGIGDDGHIAGILPNTSAVHVTDTLVTSYKTERFERVTITFTAFQNLSAAYCFVYGPDKLKPLTQLATEDIELADQPSQVLKTVKESYIYNDQIKGDDI